nr:DUF3307 domain-containing protein [Frigidibacter sp. ROC022]
MLFAHVLADFVFQTNRMASGKDQRHRDALAAHLLAVGALAVIALGQPAPVLAGLAFVHLAIDLLKPALPGRGLGPYLADQALHLATLVALAWWMPGLWASSLWAGQDWLPGLMALVAGAILATRAGGFAVGFLMRPWANVRLPRGLPNGGKLIGLLERGVIFTLVLVGQPAGIGFLIAAKSVLRFETTSRDTRAGEYVIVGTLASFGWALIVAYATRALMAALPPLGILPFSP